MRFVYEKDLLALPTMAVVLAAPHPWIKKSGTGFASKSVHAEQTLEIHKLLPIEGELVSVPRLARVIDKGADKGALIVTERKVYEKKTGDLVCTLEQTTFCVAGHALLKTYCEYDAARLKSMEVRFSAPVYPGATSRTQMWRVGNVVLFRCTTIERGKIVLNNGRRSSERGKAVTMMCMRTFSRVLSRLVREQSIFADHTSLRVGENDQGAGRTC